MEVWVLVGLVAVALAAGGVGLVRAFREQRMERTVVHASMTRQLAVLREDIAALREQLHVQ